MKNAKTITIHAKVCDSGHYSIKDENNNTIADKDCYVPDFMPGEHYGDYLDLEVDIETGQITNWKAPSESDLENYFEEEVED